MAVTMTPYGDRALRCVVDSLDDAHRLHAAVLNAELPAVTSVPAWCSVVVTVAEPDQLAAVRELVTSIDVAAVEPPQARSHVIPIRYDGPDLDQVAAQSGLSTDEVARRHAAGDYVVAFLGFAPGFPYLVGLDPALATPRRATPRARVDAGSVGIADDVTGIYPAASPGGWQVIGHIDPLESVLFDQARTPPALLAPGDRVRFIPA